MGDQGNDQQQTPEFDAFEELGRFMALHDFPDSAVERVMNAYDFAAVYTDHRREQVEAKNPVLAAKLAAYLDQEKAQKTADAAAEADAKRVEELPEPERAREEERRASLPEPLSDEETQRLLGVGDSLQRAKSYPDAWAALDAKDQEQLPRLGFNEPFDFVYKPKESS
jgi:hypothetical protein